MSPNLGRPSHILTFVMTFCCLLMLATAALLVSYVRSANERRLETQIDACYRGNDARMEINAIVAHFELGLPKLPIIDCPTVVH